MCGYPSLGQAVLSQLSPQPICLATFRYTLTSHPGDEGRGGLLVGEGTRGECPGHALHTVNLTS